MEGITAHCMVRNEPFVYYAVKSVYNFVDVILLYDTGSYDLHTMADIFRLVKEDTEGKIVFQRVPIEVDETKWTTAKGPFCYQNMQRVNIGKKGKWWVRQKMINDTHTRFFLILDGDEIYYEQGIQAIVNTTKDWKSDKVCGFVPLLWFTDMTHTFNLTRSGRIFLTKDIGMSKNIPGEIHTFENKSIGPNSHCVFSVPDIKPYAHFETHLKPWRRSVPPDQVQLFDGSLPEVMLADDSFIRRFADASKN